MLNDPQKPNRDAKNPWASNWSAERNENARYDVHEGEYLPPDPDEQRKREGNQAKGIGATAVGIAVLLAKFKTLILSFGIFKIYWIVKLLGFSWPFLLSLWLYVLLWGWRMAIIIIFALLVHELGHYFAFRNYGLKANLPVFIPLLGAFTSGEVAQNLEEDAYIALAGPLTGLVFAGACYALGVISHEAFWFAAAYFAAFLNLFNMVPTPPFDGGRIIGALSPTLWIFGFVLFIGLAVALHMPLIFVALIGFMGLPSVIAALRGHVDPRSATMTGLGRLKVGAWYLATLFALMYVFTIAHVTVPNPYVHS